MPSTILNQMENKNNNDTAKKMKQLDTKFKLKETLYSAIAEWFEIGHIPLYKYPENFHKAIWSQGAIGWGLIFNVKLSRHWLKHQ